MQPIRKLPIMSFYVNNQKVTFAFAVCIVSSLKIYFMLKYHRCSQRMNTAGKIKVVFFLNRYYAFFIL